ncbi:MAG TPA: type II TA system antitoxin MqsA family protein [Longimicrobiales bacterium]|nr:type II TA system antitoxin MqsA family protein [Longimicrobiales bacterium]
MSRSKARVCPLCGGRLAIVAEVCDVRVGKRSVRIPDRFTRCSDCGEELYAPGQLEATQQRAAYCIREEDGLLMPEEIRAIRLDLGLTQHAFERLLGTGPKTVVRWERGTVFQNQSTDALLRVIRAVPAAAGFLAERNGVEIGARPGPERIGAR